MWKNPLKKCTIEENHVYERGMTMNHFEKEALGIFPTPLHRLPNLSRELGTNVWIKRDDLCGVALGGNMARYVHILARGDCRRTA